MELPRKLLIATGNPGKLAEFRQLFTPMGVEVMGHRELGIQDPDETGLSFVENALIKARHASQLSGLPCLADDSGLCVDALNGAPGLRSARFAGEAASSQDNIDRLLTQLQDVADQQRGAHFVCVLTLLQRADDPDPLIASGRWPGSIAHRLSGSQGFGYDPIFIPQGDTASAAELAAEEKNQRSHRALALASLIRQLTNSS